MRFLVPLLLTIIFGGCMDREIYSEIADPAAIGHPPSSILLTGSGEKLVTGFEENNVSTVQIDVYIHCAKCSGAEARALGSDFDNLLYTKWSISASISATSVTSMLRRILSPMVRTTSISAPFSREE